MALPKAVTTEKKKTKERFRKRKSSFFKKANQLARLCDTKVYVLLARHDAYHVYKSTADQDWPPSTKTVVRNQSSKPHLLFHAEEISSQITLFLKWSDRQILMTTKTKRKSSIPQT